jgi:hypothetical protein
MASGLKIVWPIPDLISEPRVTAQFAQAIVDQHLVGAVVIARHEGENRTIPEGPQPSRLTPQAGFPST